MKILLVDDDLIIRMFLAEALQDLGHEVEEANGLEQALAKDLRVFDAVVTDIEMPIGHEGPEVINAAKSINPKVRCILMSGNPNNREKAGPDTQFLGKPFSVRDLEEAIGKPV